MTARITGTGSPWVPDPKAGGSYLYCPWQHVGQWCRWRKRKGRGTVKAYRQHWRRAHLRPFLAGIVRAESDLNPVDLFWRSRSTAQGVYQHG